MAIPTALKVAATVLQVGGMLGQASAERRAGAFEAAQLEKGAKDVEATGTRRAYEANRQGKVVQSNARTAMVSGGGVTSDAGAIKTLAKIKSTSDYNALAALYESKNQANKMRQQAAARRAGASAMGSVYSLGAAATALSGASKVYDYYNKPTAPTYIPGISKLNY